MTVYRFPIVWFAIALPVYFVPTVVALIRTPRHYGAAIVIDVFLGWTFLGWVIALAMACSSRPQPGYSVPPGWGPLPPSQPPTDRDWPSA
ncbi:MAG TPA: superinfection immunity protein [Streptosporangiaceae bacterium]|nr:superinfection immunity protein [Streptosporangiaceae bacterium]